MKFTLLMEDSTGRKDAMRVIADSLPDALFAFVAEAVQTDGDFSCNECDTCPCDTCQRKSAICKKPLETFSSEDTEMFLAWKSNGGRHEQRIIREVT